MLDIHEFRYRMAVLHEVHSNDSTVVLFGDSVDDVLIQASIELQVPIKKLSYEVLEQKKSLLRGSLGKAKWKLLVFPSPGYVEDKNKELVRVEAEIVVVKDADFGLKLSKDGNIYFRSFPPEGRGAQVIDWEKVLEQARILKVSQDINRELIEQIITDSDSEWYAVGTFKYDPNIMCHIGITITEDAMKATLVVTTQGGCASTPTAKEIEDELLKAGIFFGGKLDVLENFESHPVFRTPILIAEGQTPEHGKDTRLQFLFDTSNTFKTIKDIEEGGNSSQGGGGDKLYTNNVEIGQVVAEVLNPSQGIPGRTVRGELIAAKDGNYETLVLGDNVELTEDGTQVVSKADGRVVFNNDRLSVEAVLIITGDVKSCIDFLGTVIITGNVEDDFDINAKGNIHIDGTVGRSRITSCGDIYVGGGIHGDKDSSTDSNNHQVFIKCAGSIWAKFIQNCYLEADEYVVVSDGILNSEILALKKVLCRGRRSGVGADNRRAAIMGGRVRSGEEIHAVNLGSASGTTTRLEVGVNPRLQDEYNDLSKKFESKKTELLNLEKSLDNWKKSSKIKGLTPERKNRFNAILESYENLKSEVETEGVIIEEKKQLLKSSAIFARISASSRVCVGVTMSINSAEYAVTNEYTRPITFIEQEGLVVVTEYEENSEKLEKKDPPSEIRKKGLSRRKVR